MEKLQREIREMEQAVLSTQQKLQEKKQKYASMRAAMEESADVLRLAQFSDSLRQTKINFKDRLEGGVWHMCAAYDIASYSYPLLVSGFNSNWIIPQNDYSPLPEGLNLEGCAIIGVRPPTTPLEKKLHPYVIEQVSFPMKIRLMTAPDLWCGNNYYIKVMDNDTGVNITFSLNGLAHIFFYYNPRII